VNGIWVTRLSQAQVIHHQQLLTGFNDAEYIWTDINTTFHQAQNVEDALPQHSRHGGRSFLMLRRGVGDKASSTLA